MGRAVRRARARARGSIRAVAAPARARPRPTGLRAAYAARESTLLPLATFVALLAGWELGAQTGALETFFFSSPTRIIAAGWQEIQLPRFWNDVSVSGQEFLVGYLAAIAIAVPFGVVTGWYRSAHDFFDPWLSAFNATPRLALLPLVVLWVGLGMESKIVIVFLGVFFPVVINTFHGVRTVDANLVEVARSFGASGRRRLLTVVLPSVVPFALVGMRIGVGRAVGGVLVGEFYTSNAGLGNLVFRAGQTLQTDRLLFGALFITGLALLGFRAIGSLERRFGAWRPRVGSA